MVAQLAENREIEKASKGDARTHDLNEAMRRRNDSWMERATPWQRDALERMAGGK